MIKCCAIVQNKYFATYDNLDLCHIIEYRLNSKKSSYKKLKILFAQTKQIENAFFQPLSFYTLESETYITKVRVRRP